MSQETTGEEDIVATKSKKSSGVNPNFVEACQTIKAEARSVMERAYPDPLGKPVGSAGSWHYSNVTYQTKVAAQVMRLVNFLQAYKETMMPRDLVVLAELISWCFNVKQWGKPEPNDGLIFLKRCDLEGKRASAEWLTKQFNSANRRYGEEVFTAEHVKVATASILATHMLWSEEVRTIVLPLALDNACVSLIASVLALAAVDLTGLTGDEAERAARGMVLETYPELPMILSNLDQLKDPDDRKGLLEHLQLSWLDQVDLVNGRRRRLAKEAWPICRVLPPQAANRFIGKFSQFSGATQTLMDVFGRSDNWALSQWANFYLHGI